MRKVFKNPEIKVKTFSSESILTTSGNAVNDVMNMLTTENSGISIKGQTKIDEKNIISIVL